MLYQKVRPAKLDDVIGQPEAVAMIRGWGKNVPHAVLYSGPSGCGKTTLARIQANMVGCHEMDFCEVNAADTRGIDDVRSIRSRMHLAPLNKSRVWLIDEAQQLTKDAQSMYLKMLEDTPKHVYFILASTDPHKLLKTILGRCTEVKVKALDHVKAGELLDKTAKGERFKLDQEVRDRIIEVAEGNARKLLVILESILGIEDQEGQLDVILKSDNKRAAFDLVKELMPFKGSPNWGAVAKVLKDVEGEDAEQIRRLVLSAARASLLKNGSSGRGPLAYKVIVNFEGHFFDSGHAGLARACYGCLFD